MQYHMEDDIQHNPIEAKRKAVHMENLPVDEKLNRLKMIYALFDSSLNAFDTACRKKCAACCTCNVATTGLEAEMIRAALSRSQHLDLLSRIVSNVPEKRYHPVLTTNCFARFVMEDRQLPHEENDPSWGVCPLLENHTCTIYAFRPLGCRVLMSQTPCRKNGYAQMPELALTLNTIFQQIGRAHV